MSAVWLMAATRRSSSIRVYQALGEAQVVFAEPGEMPPTERFGLYAGMAMAKFSARIPAESRILATLLDILWPAGGEARDVLLRGALSCDNRIDLEDRLAEVADVIEGLLAWWTAARIPDRASLLAPLQAKDQALVQLFERSWPEAAMESGLRSGRPPAALAAIPFLAFAEGSAAVDATRQEAWQARTAEEVFGPGGGLASLLGDSYEARDGQMQMADAVDRVLKRREHLMVEAGTGIGKSLAYLVPTLLHGSRDRQRVVISTHTKALQQQLVGQDLPLLQRLGYPGKVRLLLGRNNYLCRRQLRHARRRRPESIIEARARLAFLLWAEQSEEGRREELGAHRWMDAFWDRWFASVEPCSPHICHPHPACFVVRARRAARDADVVVVNHSLLMMDLKSGQGLAGPSRILVVDEAHQLAPVATRALSHWLGPDRLEVYNNLAGDRSSGDRLREVPAKIARLAQGDEDQSQIEGRAGAMSRGLDAFQDAFRAWFLKVGDGAAERLGEHADRPGSHRYHDPQEAFGVASAEGEELLERAGSLDRSLAALLAVAGDLEERDHDLSDEREGLASLLEFHRDWCASLRFCLSAADEDWVYWFEWGGPRGFLGVVAAPLTVEDPLAALWDEHHDSIIMTSATLAVAEDFTPFAEGVGFTRVARFTDSLQVPSPFQHERQSLVLTSMELPEPGDARFPPLVADLVASIVGRVATKTLVLSTSYRFIQDLAPLLEAKLMEAGEDLFRQGEQPITTQLLVQTPGSSRPVLVDRFRRAPAAVLLATGAFWEGMDFPGKELEVLVVPRLPFAVPTEPVAQGRGERAGRQGRDPFLDVALVDAVLRLKQGVGRLLRTEDDRGAVLLLDQRLQSRPYGVTFLNSLPRTCELVPDLSEMAQRVVDFLAEGPVVPPRRR